VDCQPKKKLVHSAAYLAFRARKAQEAKGAKRESKELDADATVGAEINGAAKSKRARLDTNGDRDRDGDVEMTEFNSNSELSKTAQANTIVANLTNYLADATIAQFKRVYGEEKWDEAMSAHLQIIADVQNERESLRPEKDSGSMLALKTSGAELKLLK